MQFVGEPVELAEHVQYDAQFNNARSSSLFLILSTQFFCCFS
jgi:hypothetical protein